MNVITRDKKMDILVFELQLQTVVTKIILWKVTFL